MSDDARRQTPGPDGQGHAPIDHGPDDAPLEPTDEAAEAKVPLRSNVWQREGADAPDAADIEDPATQL